MILISSGVIGTLVMCTLCNAVQYRDIQPNRKEHNHGNYNKSADNVEGRRTLSKINFRNKTIFSIHTWAPLNSFRIFLPVNKSKCQAVIVFDRQEKMFVSHNWILLEQIHFNQLIPFSFTRQKPTSSRINGHLITQSLGPYSSVQVVIILSRFP